MSSSTLSQFLDGVFVVVIVVIVNVFEVVFVVAVVHFLVT